MQQQDKPYQREEQPGTPPGLGSVSRLRAVTCPGCTSSHGEHQEPPRENWLDFTQPQSLVWCLQGMETREKLGGTCHDPALLLVQETPLLHPWSFCWCSQPPPKGPRLILYIPVGQSDIRSLAGEFPHQSFHT